jgi:hypothetical protein
MSVTGPMLGLSVAAWHRMHSLAAGMATSRLAEISLLQMEQDLIVLRYVYLNCSGPTIGVYRRLRFTTPLLRHFATLAIRHISATGFRVSHSEEWVFPSGNLWSLVAHCKLVILIFEWIKLSLTSHCDSNRLQCVQDVYSVAMGSQHVGQPFVAECRLIQPCSSQLDTSC